MRIETFKPRSNHGLRKPLDDTARARKSLIAEFELVSRSTHQRLRKARAWQAASNPDTEFCASDRRRLVSEYVSFCTSYGIHPVGSGAHRAVVKTLVASAKERLAEMSERRRRIPWHLSR